VIKGCNGTRQICTTASPLAARLNPILPPWCMPFFVNVVRHISAISSNSSSALKNLDADSSIPLQPTQLLSWGHKPSSRSAFLSICGLNIWNQISPDIRSWETSFCSGFAHSAKTYLFVPVMWTLYCTISLLLQIWHYNMYSYDY